MEESIFDINLSKISSYDENFDLAKTCASFLSSGQHEADVRKVVIKILDNWDNIPVETHPIWTDLIESLGFYPYVEKNKERMDVPSFADEVRKQYFSSDYLPGTYLHKEQKKLSEYLFSGKNVIASAPTSFGKSLLIEELIASKQYKNIVIIQPTLALLDETRIKMRKYSSNYKIIVRTTQKPIENKGNLFLLTAERVMEYDLFPHIDLLIIDEFYKLSLKRSDERASILNNAFMRIMDQYKPKFYLLGPNIDDITAGFAEKYEAEFYKSEFSLVDCDVIDMTQDLKDTDKNELLFQLLDKLALQQTLIYCSSPAKTREYAKMYMEHLEFQGVTPETNLSLIQWIEKNVTPHWSLAKELSYGIAIHDGSLQKHVGSSIIRYFNNGLIRCIFCTTTIIEGVNTSAKNVILFENKKGTFPIDYFDYSNIKGRSGRLMEHYVGNIYNFSSPPERERVVIDIPFFEQNPDPKFLPDEILVNIREEDVRDRVSDRYRDLYKTDSELLSIIKKNGVSIINQKKMVSILEKDINNPTKYSKIYWKAYPSYENTLYLLTLAEQSGFIIGRSIGHGVVSTKQLAYNLDLYRKRQNILFIVENMMKQRLRRVTPDAKGVKRLSVKSYDIAVENAFHIYRHWFQFKIPKIFSVVDSLQKYVCEKAGKASGSYGYFIEQLENDFTRKNLSILLEYGIPSNAVRDLEAYIPDYYNEDEVLQYIKDNKENVCRNLSEYEKERLNYCM